MGLINLLPFLKALQKPTPDSAGTQSGAGSAGGSPQQGASPDDRGWNPLSNFRTPPPPPAAPPPPGPPAVLNPGTPQYQLAQVQEQARNNPKYVPPYPKGDPRRETYCNIAVADQLKGVGEDNSDLLDPDTGKPALVNQQIEQLADPDSNWRAVSAEEAQDFTNKTGRPALGIQANPGVDSQGREKHGHIVTLVPEVFPQTSHSEGWFPQVNNIGAADEVTTADKAFSSKRPVVYYIPKK